MVRRNTRLEHKVSFPKDKSEWYAFLDGNVEFALEVRNFIESLPKTATTFKTRDLPPDNTRSEYVSKIVKLMGAWKAPSVLFNQTDTWVNPNAKHAFHYSDAVTKCECGIPVLREQFSENEPQPTHHQEHKDECTKINRVECRLKMLKRKKEIIIDQYKHNQSLEQSKARLGYSGQSRFSGSEVKDLGIDIDALSRNARQRFARTCMVLARKHNPETIGKIFGMTSHAIGRVLSKETQTDTQKLYAVRRNL